MTQTEAQTPFHVVSDPHNNIKLITTEQRRAFDKVNELGVRKEGARLSSMPASELFEKTSLKDVAETMDDESWTRFSAFMRQRIAHLREREEEHQISIPPAIFQVNHVDLPLDAVYFRLHQISEHRKNNSNDLESGQELIESAMIERFNRPAVQERFTPATWNNELFEHRLDEDFETLQHAHEHFAHREGALFDEAYNALNANEHGLSPEQLDWMSAFTQKIELKELVENHADPEHSLATSVRMF